MPTDNRRNYYRILHVQPDAPLEIIKSSYRTLMQRLRMHPDLGGDHWNASLLNEAYAVLTDPARRAAYDRELPDFERSAASAEAAGAAPAAAPDGPAARRGTATGEPGCPFCHAAFTGQVTADSQCPSCLSPLARAGNHAHDGDWLRAVARVPKALPLQFWTAWPQAVPEAGLVRDLSLTGVRFSSPLPLALGSFLKLQCDAFQAVARVVHCQPEAAGAPGWQVGAEFFTLRFSRSRGGFVSAEA